MRTALALSSGVVLLCAIAQTASAQNLVANPGFETGDFTGWTQFGNTDFTDVSDFLVHSGDFSGEFGPTDEDGPFGGVFQTLATTPGTTYTFSFWLADDADAEEGGITFAASWDGTTVFSLSDPDSFDFTKFSFTETAGANPTDMRFAFLNDPSFWYLDDVSVTADTGVVPEPASMSLVAMGLVGMAGFRRRRRSVTR